MVTPSPGPQRLFVALRLPETVRRQLQAVVYPMPGFSWIPVENLHLTMRFLGEILQDRRAKLEERLAGVKVEPFILPIEGTGAFPPRRPPKVVWVGTGRSHPRLFQLRQRIDDSLLMGGFDVDMRSFHAHVTVARLGEETMGLAQQWVVENEEFIAAPFRVDGFGLYSSLPGPNGSVYTLERWFSFEEPPAEIPPRSLSGPAYPESMDVFGTRCRLMVLRLATPGVYLDGGDRGEILLPGRYVPRGTIVGEAFDVFVHRDSEDRLVATTENVLVVVGEFAALRVVSVNPAVGAFLDWGLAKDLLLPIREQAHRVRPGEIVVVYVYIDEHTDRIVASSRTNRHLDKSAPTYGERERVSLLISGITDLGFNAIVNNKHLGLLYGNELTAPLHIGQTMDGYVREVREDGKIDLSLHAAGVRPGGAP